ncbi:MAG: HD domain-containing protein [Clostridiales bacterium]|nr:HD domain-containing protein [Clostridiales bacterium]
MIPTIPQAMEELRLAGEMNPGPWVMHSVNVGEAARRIAARIEGMDAGKACVLGLLHDIGRRVGVVNITRHVLAGYEYACQQRWDEVARICMTHSYILMERDIDEGSASPEEQDIRRYLTACQPDRYDLLIQLCDSIATDYGFVILEKRFVDVARRYGIWPTTIERWNRTFAIKEEFEALMGCSVYDVLPDIGRTTLLSPPPWTPPKGASIT